MVSLHPGKTKKSTRREAVRVQQVQQPETVATKPDRRRPTKGQVATAAGVAAVLTTAAFFGLGANQGDNAPSTPDDDHSADPGDTNGGEATGLVLVLGQDVGEQVVFDPGLAADAAAAMGVDAADFLSMPYDPATNQFHDGTSATWNNPANGERLLLSVGPTSATYTSVTSGSVTQDYLAQYNKAAGQPGVRPLIIDGLTNAFYEPRAGQVSGYDANSGLLFSVALAEQGGAPANDALNRLLPFVAGLAGQEAA